MKLTPELSATLANGLVKQAQLAADFPREGYVLAYGEFALPMYVTDSREGEQFGLLGTSIKIFRTEGEADEVANQINATKFYTTQVRSMPSTEWSIAFLLGSVKMAAEAMKGAE